MSALQRILIASPVRQSPNVLKAFLSSLSSLSIREDEIEVSYVFIDDNEVQASSKQLRAFVRKHGGRVVKAKAIEKPKKTVIQRSRAGAASVSVNAEDTAGTLEMSIVETPRTEISKVEASISSLQESIVTVSTAEDDPRVNENTQVYTRNEYSHYWPEEYIWRVAALKDWILSYAIEEAFDSLFLLDSDLVLHPATLTQLLNGEEEIVANLFWTRWQPGTIEMPQVWLRDEYTLYEESRNEQLTEEEKQRRSAEFMRRLRKKGRYEVGGLGACTLIRRSALEKGVRFARIENLTLWGEDRHFCVRAQALGVKLHVDTHYPAYHIYRDSDLDGVTAFLQSASKHTGEGTEGSKHILISLCMIVKNEEKSLARCLDSVREIADEIVIVDTGSTDRTREIAKDYDCRIVDYTWKDHFGDARNFAFSQAEGEYILWLDADDVFEEKDRQQLLDWRERLDSSIDGLSMEYHLAFDGSGNVSHKLRRNRLVRRDKGFEWHGAVHEYLAVSGNIIHTNIAVTHKKDKKYTDRNLRIYKRLEEQGEAFTARDQYYYANELRDHGLNEEAVRWYTRFLDSGHGWIEDNLSACMKLAECMGRLGMKEQELAALFRSFTYEIPRAEACCRIGAWFAERMEWNKAIHWFETAVSLKRPEDPLANIDEPSWTWIPHLQLCVCYDRLGDHEQANYHNELALRYHPTHPSMLYNQQYLKEKLQNGVLR